MHIINTSVNIILFGLLYFPIFPQLFYEWKDNPDYSHGFIIPIISLYFIWRKRNDFKGTAISPSITGLFVIFLGLLIYSMAKLSGVSSFQYFSMLFVISGLVYAQAGKNMLKKTFFPIFYLIFMFPIPSLLYTTITFRLRLFATYISYTIIRLFGINAAREGNIINLPHCQLIVATPCSGIRSLITFMAASLAIGYIFQENNIKRALLFGFSILLAILMNIIRLVLTAVISHALKVTEVPPSVHDAAGYAVLVIGFLILFVVNDYLKKKI